MLIALKNGTTVGPICMIVHAWVHKLYICTVLYDSAYTALTVRFRAVLSWLLFFSKSGSSFFFFFGPHNGLVRVNPTKVTSQTLNQNSWPKHVCFHNICLRIDG